MDMPGLPPVRVKVLPPVFFNVVVRPELFVFWTTCPNCNERGVREAIGGLLAGANVRHTACQSSEPEKVSTIDPQVFAPIEFV